MQTQMAVLVANATCQAALMAAVPANAWALTSICDSGEGGYNNFDAILTLFLSSHASTNAVTTTVLDRVVSSRCSTNRADWRTFGLVVSKSGPTSAPARSDAGPALRPRSQPISPAASRCGRAATPWSGLASPSPYICPGPSPTVPRRRGPSLKAARTIPSGGSRGATAARPATRTALAQRSAATGHAW